MNITIFKAAAGNRWLDNVEKSVLFGLANYANKDNVAWPSHQTLADILSLNRRTIIRGIQKLIKKGVISLTDVQKQQSKTYKINIEILNSINDLTINLASDRESHVTESHGGCDRESQGGCHRVTGGVTESHTNNTTNNTMKDTRKGLLCKKLEKNNFSPPPKKVKKVTNCPYEKILDIYHETLPNLKKTAKLTPQRKVHMLARWKEYPHLDFFEQLFDAVKESKFLLGENNRGWKADLEWLMNTNNFIKVIEGKYNVK